MQPGEFARAFSVRGEPTPGPTSHAPHAAAMQSTHTHACREVLLPLLPDVHVYSDTYKGATSGASPGYGITLTAHTTSGCMYAAQRSTGPPPLGAVLPDAADAGPVLPEDLAHDAGALLLDEVARGGCIGSPLQPLVLTFMALCPEDVSRLRLGALSPRAVATLRLLQAIWGVVFKLTPQRAGGGAVAAAPPLPPAAGGAGSAASALAAGAALSGKKRGRGSGVAVAAAAPPPTAMPSGGDDDAATAPIVDPLTGAPITAAVASSASAATVLVSVLGVGLSNASKKVT